MSKKNNSTDSTSNTVSPQATQPGTLLVSNQNAIQATIPAATLTTTPVSSHSTNTGADSLGYVEPVSTDYLQSKFYKVRLYSVPKDMEDTVTELSFEFNATGITEALQFSQPDLTYEPDIVFKRSHDLDIYFNASPDKAYFEKLNEWMPNVRWEIIEEESKDWLAEWKKSFKPFAFVGPYWIVPTWMEKPPEAPIGLFIDPGMAFGTGTHPTTKMAAYFVHKLGESFKKNSNHTNNESQFHLQKQSVLTSPTTQDKNTSDSNKQRPHNTQNIKAQSELATKSLLDVGTGTAVLAMMAHLEGIGKVVGIEIDPEARRVAKENVLRNELLDVEISDALLEEVRETFDFVVANIIDGVLIRIKNDLLRVLKPGGQIFLTGILTERDNLFFEKFIETSPLQVIRRLEKDEWVGYWLQDTRLHVVRNSANDTANTLESN